LSMAVWSAVSATATVCADDNDDEVWERLYLQSGERLAGRHEGFENGEVIWQLRTGADLRVPLGAIDRIEYPPPRQFVIDPDAAFEDDSDEPSPPSHLPEWLHWAEPAYASTANLLSSTAGGFTRWTKRVEAGARLIDGNSDEDFLSAAAKFERAGNNWLAQIDLFGRYGKSDGDVTTNRWSGNVNYDYGRHGKWIVFATAKNEFDEFENLDYRGTYSSGIGYRFFNEEQRRLIVRLGPAFTYEQFDEPKNIRTTPDGFGELEIDWPLFRRSSFETKTTVHPSLRNFNVLRLVSDNGLLFQLDEAGQWKLKFGFRVEFNNRPNNDREPTDYTTNVLLVFTHK